MTLKTRDIMNCLVGKVEKSDGKVRLSLVDIVGQEYGRVELDDDFGFDLSSVENVALQVFIEKEVNDEKLIPFVKGGACINVGQICNLGYACDGCPYNKANLEGIPK